MQNRLSIKCNDLRLTENGLYDDPQARAMFLRTCDPSFKPGDEYSKHQQSVYEEIRECEGNPHKSRQAAYTLAHEIIWAFNAYQRTGLECIDDDLRALTDWLPVGYVQGDLGDSKDIN